MKMVAYNLIWVTVKSEAIRVSFSGEIGILDYQGSTGSSFFCNKKARDNQNHLWEVSVQTLHKWKKPEQLIIRRRYSISSEILFQFELLIIKSDFLDFIPKEELGVSNFGKYIFSESLTLLTIWDGWMSISIGEDCWSVSSFSLSNLRQNQQVKNGTIDSTFPM